MTVPVFINCRDRLTSLLALLDYLERAGCEDIYLLDNDSSYEPLLDYYGNTPHQVIRLGANIGQHALWKVKLLDEIPVPGPFLLSDPDIVPIEECPLDAIDYLGEILEQYHDYVKVGFGLKIDDLPDQYQHKSEVIVWESAFWKRPLAPNLYDAQIDTTFALYRNGENFGMYQAIRTGYPYLARHTTWYLDDGEVPEDERYYSTHADLAVMNWSRDRIPAWFARKIERMKTDSDNPAPHRGPKEGVSRRVGLVEARDPEFTLAASAWHGEPEPVDEALYTSWAEPGWRSWNDMSPEAEFCEFAAALVRMVRPASVIETGTGQGFLTRRIAQHLDQKQRLTCFEENRLWREALASLPFFQDSRFALSPNESPSDSDFAGTAFCILDSGFRLRFRELEGWWRSAESGAILLVHDTGNGHAPELPHSRLARRIGELGIPGSFLKNPRGGFLGLKP